MCDDAEIPYVFHGLILEIWLFSEVVLERNEEPPEEI
jgi:hypothetical protein